MIKVLEILPTLNYCGGAEAYVTNYCFNLDNLEIQIDYIIHGTPQSSNYIQEALNKGSKVFIMPSFSIKNIPQIKKEFLEIIQNNHYDIIHSHQANSAFLYFKLCKKYISHRIIHSHQSKAADSFTHAIRNKPLLYIGTKLSTNYMACSKKAGDYLFKKKPFKILNNAIYSDKFQFNLNYRNEIRNKFSISDDTLLIGHIGRFCNQKNQSFLISLLPNLLKKNKKIKLIFIGVGEKLDECKNLVKKLNIEENVIFAGASKEAYKFYSAFDILVLPSRYEGIPTVGIEATYSSLNVITTTNVTRELNFNNNVSFLSLHDSHEFWCNEIINRIKDPKDRIKVDNFDYDIKHQAKKII